MKKILSLITLTTMLCSFAVVAEEMEIANDPDSKSAVWVTVFTHTLPREDPHVVTVCLTPGSNIFYNVDIERSPYYQVRAEFSEGMKCSGTYTKRTNEFITLGQSSLVIVLDDF